MMANWFIFVALYTQTGALIVQQVTDEVAGMLDICMYRQGSVSSMLMLR